MSVRKAVIPAAGRGTRLLPVTRGIAKELLPIVDRPSLQYVVEEAADAGIEEVILVTADRPEKAAIVPYFTDVPSDERLASLEALSGRVRVTSVFQDRPLGLGHAVLCAREAVGEEPFAVLLPDDLFTGALLPTAALVRSYERDGGGGHVILIQVPEAHTHRYGIAGGQRDPDGRLQIDALIEKPTQGTAPTDLALVGRYVLPPETWSLLEATAPGHGGEIQLTDALVGLMGEPGLVGVMHQGVRHDAGNKAGYVLANAAFALDRADIGDEVAAGLRRLLNERV